MLPSIPAEDVKERPIERGADAARHRPHGLDSGYAVLRETKFAKTILLEAVKMGQIRICLNAEYGHAALIIESDLTATHGASGTEGSVLETRGGA
jgi:hypothetical protein